MNNLAINNDLDTAGTQLVTSSTELDTLVRQINDIIARTQDAWQGQASQAYQEQWQALYPQFLNAKEVINTLGIQINQYYTSHAELEQAASNHWKG